MRGTTEQPGAASHEPSSVDRPLSEVGVVELPERGVMVDWLRLLWNARSMLFRVTGAGLLFGLLLALLIPKQYEATTRLMPPDSQSNSGMAMLAALTSKSGMGLGSIAGDLLGVKSSGDLFIGILRSRTVEDRLVQRFDLKSVYSVGMDMDARRKLEERTGIGADRKSGIITLVVTDRDPKRAAAMAQAYVQELGQLVVDLSTSSARRERVFLEGRLTAVKQALDDDSKAFSEFASKNTTIDIKDQGKAMMDAAATLMGQLIAAESELKGLEEIYTPNNVRVRSVQGRIGELRKQLLAMGGKEGSGPGTVGASEEMPYPSIRKLPLLAVTYADLYRKVKIQEVVYETLTQEYELAKVQEAKEIPNVKVLDPAVVPERKSFPSRALVVLLCGLASLAGAAVFALSRRQWEEWDPQDPGKVLAQEVLQTVNAQMPWAPPNGSRFQSAAHRVWTRLVRRNGTSEVDEKPES
jgi:uncharacterized protein involved in exopolysaccharide biosynthesis